MADCSLAGYDQLKVEHSCKEEDKRQLSRWRLPLRFAVVMAASMASFAAGAQNASGPSPIAAVEVFLIRQDFSDCTNANVNANNPSSIGGTAWMVRQSDGNTSVKVAITASPNTVYRLYLKCVRQIGDITTQDEGEGNGVFEFPTNLTGSVYAFDMYPDGAPSGNKFQSVQVKFP